MITVTPEYLAQFNAAARAHGFEVGLIAQSNYNFPIDITPTATASSSKSSYMSPACAIDGETRESYKYWILGQGCKIGIDPATGRTHGWRLFGPGMKHNLGWWSSSKSDASGNFSVYPYHETAFSQAIEGNLVRVVTSSVYSGIAEFVLKLWYEGAGSYATIGTYTIGTSDTVKVVDLGENKMISKVKVEVTKTKAASDYAKIVEVEVVKEFSTGITGGSPATLHVIDYSVEKSSGDSAPGKPAAPGVGANSLSLTFSRSIKELADIKENMILTVKQGFGSNLVNLGSFIIMEPPEETLAGYSVKAYSTLQLAKVYSVPDLIFNNQKTSAIVSHVLGALGIPSDKITFNLTSDTTWTWYILQGAKIDSVLQSMADHFGVAIYQTEDGTVVVRSSYGSSAYTFTDSIIKDISIQSAATINAVAVHYSIVSEQPEDEVWSLDNDITVPASSSVSYIFPLSKTPAIKLKAPRYTEDSEGVEAYVSISSWKSNGFYLNLTLTNSAGSSKTVPARSIIMRGKPLGLTAERVYEARNDSSIRRIGRREFSTNLFCSSDSVAQAVANRMLTYLNKAAEVYRVTLDRPMPHAQARDVVTLDSDIFSVNKDVVITKIGLDKGQTTFDAISKEAVT